MNTNNNRNVRLQQHVVLLTVMEHAEDLIKKIKLFMTILYIYIFLYYILTYIQNNGGVSLKKASNTMDF